MERENVGRRETPYTCSTDIRVKEKEEARISQEESVEINEQTSINNNTIIDKLYIKVKQIISKYIKKGPRKIPYYDFYLFFFTTTTTTHEGCNSIILNAIIKHLIRYYYVVSYIKSKAIYFQFYRCLLRSISLASASSNNLANISFNSFSNCCFWLEFCAILSVYSSFNTLALSKYS